MKKILLVLLLLVLLLAGSAPAYARIDPPNPFPFRMITECTVTNHINDTYWMGILGTDPYLHVLGQDQIWYRMLIPAYPEVGSVWHCKVEGLVYIECPDLICGYVYTVERVTLRDELTP
jgi:hypothetical protein